MATTKRTNGEGNVWHNAKRKRWEGRITVAVIDGKPKRRTFTGPTRKVVVDRMKVAQRDLDGGVDGITAEQTVERFLEWWLTDALPGTVADRTLEGYAEVARLYVIPHVGRHKLKALNSTHVTSMIRTLEREGLSANTQRLARSILRRALRRAENDQIVTRNVAAIADGPKVKAKEGRSMTADQARQLLAHLPDASDRVARLEAAFVLMLSLGLRRGELLGLAWDDLDLEGDHPALTVRSTLKRIKGTGLVLTEPKTSGSRRTRNLGSNVVAAMRAHRTRQVAERLHAGPEWDKLPLGRDLVFRTPFGTALDPNNFRQITYRATEGAGIGRWSPHELRHTAASLMLARGVPLEVVSETLGHASIRITADVYAHLMAPAKTAAADAMDEVLFGDGP